MTDEEVIAVHNAAVEAYEARRRPPTPLEATDLEEARTIHALALSEALLIKGSTVKPSKAVVDLVIARLLDAGSEVSRLEAKLYEEGTDGDL